MILSDFDLDNFIRSKRLTIEPFDKELIRENGLDLTLSNNIGVKNPELGADFALDPSNPEHLKREYIISANDKELIIPGKSQVLLSTKEFVKMPDNLIGFVELRSTWARHGLLAPPTIIDAGFEGEIVIEIYNTAEHKIILRPGVRFVHIIFAITMNKVEKSYRGGYTNQRGIRTPKPV